MKNGKMFLSVILFTAAVASAFTTTASKNAKAVSSVPGYIKQGPTCVFKNNCDNVNTGVLCTETQTGGAQIFGMTDATHCAVQLWRLN
ncbi:MULTISPECIES: DUF6520 family protein [Flavobacterium]|jgi:hypothetical protein|uniref:DUF6520 family protein n=1 Tax=Flavobacterium TaxID=237 RepID=UPI00138B0A65|nr:DUF6520 family protein [Flavobacterium phycosphaerae]